MAGGAMVAVAIIAARSDVPTVIIGGTLPRNIAQS
jgi:hypothetical protein